MKLVSREIKKKAIKKASQSPCNHKIVAIGFDKNNKYLGMTYNKPRFSRSGGGLHAEMLLMSKYGRLLSKIVIFRVNPSGDTLPIDPCERCQAKADDLGVRIVIL